MNSVNLVVKIFLLIWWQQVSSLAGMWNESSGNSIISANLTNSEFMSSFVEHRKKSQRQSGWPFLTNSRATFEGLKRSRRKSCSSHRYLLKLTVIFLRLGLSSVPWGNRVALRMSGMFPGYIRNLHLNCWSMSLTSGSDWAEKLHRWWDFEAGTSEALILIPPLPQVLRTSILVCVYPPGSYFAILLPVMNSSSLWLSRVIGWCIGTMARRRICGVYNINKSRIIERVVSVWHTTI